MSELIDRIPGQESTIARLRGVVDTTMQMKSRQRLSGRSGQLGYAVDSGNAWDYTATLPCSDASFELANYHIIFTGNGTQKYPIVIPQLDVRINGTATANRLKLDFFTSEYKYEDAIVEVNAFEFGRPVPAYFASTIQNVWNLHLFYIGNVPSGTFTLRIKALAQASCDGVFTVVRVA